MTTCACSTLVQYFTFACAKQGHGEEWSSPSHLLNLLFMQIISCFLGRHFIMATLFCTFVLSASTRMFVHAHQFHNAVIGFRTLASEFALTHPICHLMTMIKQKAYQYRLSVALYEHLAGRTFHSKGQVYGQMFTQCLPGCARQNSQSVTPSHSMASPAYLVRHRQNLQGFGNVQEKTSVLRSKTIQKSKAQLSD